MIAAVNAASSDDTDISEELKKSLIYLDISVYAYNQAQPWKPADVNRKFGYAAAVAPYQVLTTAWNVTNVALIKARRHGQNEFIPATVKVIDYESNLCLIDLDPTAMSGPLKPLTFTEDYGKGAQLRSYWLSSGGHLTSGRAYLDRAEVNLSATSYNRFLNYIAADISNGIARAKLYCMNAKPIGLAYWASDESQEAGIAPAETINRFLADAADGNYQGSGTTGFAAKTLLDPAKRAWLKMPPNLKHGVYVNKVYTIGTGSDVLKQNDVILAINGKTLNPYGRYLHPKFDRISFRHIIASHNVGQAMIFKIFRDGKEQELEVIARNFQASEMLIPHHEYGKEPEYIVTAGFIFQKLTRNYLLMWGDDWGGKAPPHLYHYYRDLAFKPSDERSDIVILSYILPADINLGYHGLGRMIVKTFNGKSIGSIGDVLDAQKLNPDSKYDVVEFEHDYPAVVISRDQLGQANAMIAQNYGITKLTNIKK